MSVDFHDSASTDASSGGTSLPASSEDAQFAARLLALQALAYQRIELDTVFAECKKRVYRKRDQIDLAIADLMRGIDGPVYGEDFIIKPRRQVARASGHLSPSQRRKDRLRSSFSVELAA